jgi:hypothetical protein
MSNRRIIEINRTNEPDTCLYCGEKLKEAKYSPKTGNKGYANRGYFCTLTCGWRFGVAAAKHGFKLQPYRGEL